MSEEKLDFTRRFLVSANLGLLAWVLLAALTVGFYNQLYGWLYLAFLAFIIYVILRRLGCSSCYNCKSCTSGFGRLAGVFFGKGNLKKGSVGNRIGLVVFLYAVLMPIPAVLGILSVLAAFSYVEVAVLVCLVAVSCVSLTTWSR
ncbi:MAG: hypothetical protein M1540_04160 [Candidatus Bathyarchaeota archaeon]|nr:hypothetical protein [Candidatus Bathyarchaeota archaeon]